MKPYGACVFRARGGGAPSNLRLVQPHGCDLGLTCSRARALTSSSSVAPAAPACSSSSSISITISGRGRGGGGGVHMRSWRQLSASMRRSVGFAALQTRIMSFHSRQALGTLRGSATQAQWCFFFLEKTDRAAEAQPDVAELSRGHACMEAVSVAHRFTDRWRNDVR